MPAGSEYLSSEYDRHFSPVVVIAHMQSVNTGIARITGIAGSVLPNMRMKCGDEPKKRGEQQEFYQLL